MFIRAILIAIVIAISGIGAANAVPRAAVLPFEMQIDLQMDGLDLYGLPPKPKKAEAARLELAREALVKMLEERGAYEVVDLSQYRSEINRAAPFDRCQGCEVEFGKVSNADVTILCVVHKSSELLINMAIYVRDVKSGELQQTMVASILQNDDTGWLKAIRNLVNSRLAPKSEPK
ncbi:MAG: DUF3280 domain-containing protein [Alphaproteobacteria bacterium]|nr:DUF3280 domain-containing protein [Alphaproteobacteria bacterium]